jgi:hypothetical protein
VPRVPLPGQESQLGPGLFGPVTYADAAGDGLTVGLAPGPGDVECEQDADTITASVITTEAKRARTTDLRSLRGTVTNPTRALAVVKQDGVAATIRG